MKNLRNTEKSEKRASNFLKENTPGIPIIGFLPADLLVQEADRLGIPVFDHVPSLKTEAFKIVEKLDKLYEERQIK